MIPKIICFLFGHKRREKAYTGEQITGKDNGGYPYLISMYEWKYLKMCPRCGKQLDTA